MLYCIDFQTYISIIVCFSLPVLFAQDFDYLPANTRHQILSYGHFIISYNEEHEQADWVAYELTRGEVALDGIRCRDCFKKM